MRLSAVLLALALALFLLACDPSATQIPGEVAGCGLAQAAVRTACDAGALDPLADPGCADAARAAIRACALPK